jgi:hypothetical protein
MSNVKADVTYGKDKLTMQRTDLPTQLQGHQIG